MSEQGDRAPRVVVLGWTEGHERTAGIAHALGVEPDFMPWARHGLPRAAKVRSWFRSAARTRSLVRAASADAVVVCQAPPVFAPLVVLLCRRPGQRLVMDAHSGVFNDSRWSWAERIQRWVLARCDLLVVTNTALLQGQRIPRDLAVTVVHDPLTPRPGRAEPASAAPVVVFPASGMSDEPLDAVRDAAALLAADGIEIVVTGRQKAMAPAPGLRLSGWLERDDYEALLDSSVAILALTTREHTMQRAAYEALERRIPVVCSSTDALRTAFGDAARYATADGPSIAAAVLQARQDRDQMLRAGDRVLEDMTTTTRDGIDRVRRMAGPS